MKLNNILIVTLADFTRHFTFSSFWANRQQFIRDLCPEKVYYLNNEQKHAYTTISQCIQEDSIGAEKDNTLLCNALDELLGYKIDRKVVEAFFHPAAIDSDIIVINAPATLDLPKYKEKSDTPFSIKLHKLQIEGNVNQEVTIYIGGVFTATLKSGEVAYTTEVGGGYIEVLPNHLSNDRYDASLINVNDEFYSTLILHDKRNASNTSWNGVTSFTLVDDGYLFVDRHGNLISMTETTPKFLLKGEGKVIYLKSSHNEVLALYENGNLKSTTSMQKVPNVMSANFNIDGLIEYK